MKILELRFKNLNSLYGEWYIDFRNPEYSSNGIFALTGPTGAGKSTILDAVCLALYGSTPRLGRITKSSNEIMSRQTGECFSEVVFQSQEGVFRCFWEQHRARRSSDGNLTEATHEISDNDTGKIIENKKSIVTSVIEEKTGMDFDRFTRSILLAQGSFDTFLKANPEQKAKILEQITGTEIYSVISQRVHEKLKDEKNKLELLQAETSAINILDEEEEKELENRLNDYQVNDKELENKCRKDEKSIQWLSNILNIEKEIFNLEQESEILDKEITDFKDERIKLETSVKAAVFDSEYSTLLAERRQQEEDEKSLKDKENELPSADMDYSNKLTKMEEAEKNNESLKAESKILLPVIQKTKNLDIKINEIEDMINRKKTDIDKIKSEINNKNDEKSKILSEIKNTENNLKKAEKYIESHKSDGELSSVISSIEENITILNIKKNEIDKKKSEKNELVVEMENIKSETDLLTRTVLEIKENYEEKVQLHRKAEEGLKRLLSGKMLREYVSERDSLNRELILLNRIAGLEEQRKMLKDGIPCPLCGSPEHPYATGNIPEKGETEEKIENLNIIIESADQQQEIIRELENTKAFSLSEFNNAEKDVSEMISKSRITENRILSIDENISETESEFKRMHESFREKMLKYSVDLSNEDNYENVIASLKSRYEIWINHSSQKDHLEKKLIELEGDIRKIDAYLESLSSSFEDREKDMAETEKEYKENKFKRTEIFGAKNPESEEKRLDDELMISENNLKIARHNHDESLKNISTIKNNIDLLNKIIIKRKDQIEIIEKAFLENISESGFSGEHEYIDARLQQDERNTLLEKANTLEKRNTEIEARLKDRRKRISEEKELKYTDKNMDQIQSEYSKNMEDLKNIRDEIASLNQRLKDNAIQRGKIRDRQSEIDLQKRECIRWDRLHSLIGSADGKKYRKFAQGITFQMMVSHANKELENMSDRYLLVQNSEEQLVLDVIDNYQAGEIRSVKNLSGGESFIVSLSLALGLSKMASRKVRVDSLFLDEGFGTLDEDALETALETLSSLQQDGKLIGVISHVSALKERISTQITVNPVSGGKSKIEGPGCKSIK